MTNDDTDFHSLEAKFRKAVAEISKWDAQNVHDLESLAYRAHGIAERMTERGDPVVAPEYEVTILDAVAEVGMARLDLVEERFRDSRKLEGHVDIAAIDVRGYRMYFGNFDSLDFAFEEPFEDDEEDEDEE